MEHEALIALSAILLIGWVLFFCALVLTGKMRRTKVSILFLFKDFRQKIWMTFGLGITFFGLYFLCIYAGSFFTDPEKRLALFFLMYQHPTFFIYLGLFTFACLSATIYLVRMLIKYLCNKKT